LFRALAVNDYINSVEQIKLFVGDLAFYKDLYKRTSAFTGVKKTVRYDQDWWNWLNINKKRYDKKISDGKIGVFVYEDSTQKSNYFREYLDSLLASGIDEQKAKDILSAYNKMDEADAQGYITLDEYREFFNGAGETFSEPQYQYELNLMKMDKGEEYDKDIIAKGNPGYYFMPIKAQYSGPQDYQGLYAPAFHKYSLMPLQYSLVKGRNLEGLLDNMVKNKVGYSVFKSGSKVGTKVNKKGKANKFYTNTISGDINNDNLQIQTIDYKFLGIQLDISPKLKTEVIFGTQFRKLLFSNLFEGGIEQMTKSKELFDEYSVIFKDLIATEKKKLINELGLDPNNNYKSKDVTKLVELLKEESKDRNLADNIIDALQTEEINGKIELKYRFDSMPNKDKINSMIMSLVNSRLIRQMMNGDAMIQGASTGFEKKGRRVEGSNDLKFYRKSEDKKTLAMEIKVPLTGDYKLLMAAHGGTIESLNKALREGKVNKKFITWVGYRIPTQGLNSIEFMEIQEFLTEGSGNLIVLPTEIVAKSGGDFDIDKLNIFRPWLSPSTDIQKKQNRIIDIAREVLEQEFNFNALITPNSTSLLTDVVEELRFIEFKNTHPDTNLTLKEYNKKFKDELKNIRYTNQLKLTTKVDQFSKFLGGKAGVGIGAIHNTHHILSQIANLSLNKEYIDDKSKKQPVKIFFPHNKTKDGLIDISKVKDVKDNNNISEVISQVINASVDIAKDPFMFDLNMDSVTLSTYLYLIRTGVEFEQVAYFMKQPIIAEFLKESSINKSVFLKAGGESKTDNEIINGKQKYINGEIIITEEGLVQKYKKRLQDKLKLTDDEFDTYIEDTKPRYDITTNELKSYLSKGNQDSVAYLHVQLQAIEDYQNYKKQAGLLSDAINSVNHDTAGLGSNINSSRNKEEQKGRVKKTNFVNNINNIYTQTFVGDFDQHKFTIDAYQDFYHTQSKDIVDNNRFLLEKIAGKYTKELDRNRLSNLIENDFINYVVQNYGFDAEISSVVNNLFKGNQSVANKLLRLKMGEDLTTDEAKLSKNLLIKELYPMLADKKQHPTTDNVRIYSKKFDTFTSNQLTQSFIELEKADPLFAKQLMDLGIIQSGLNNSAITYVGIIPFQYYGDLVNKSFAEFNKKNGAQDLYKFNQLFIRNNHKSPLVYSKAKNTYLGKGDVYGDSLKSARDNGIKLTSRVENYTDKFGEAKQRTVYSYDNAIGNGMYGKNYDVNEYKVDLASFKFEEERVDVIDITNIQNTEEETLPSIVENSQNDIEDETEEVVEVKTIPEFKPANKEQIDAIASIKDFIDNGKPNEWFTLEGKAGTGKTTLIQEALKDYIGKKSILIGALSHKAKLVLKEKLEDRFGKKAFTSNSIAGMLGMTMDPETGKFKKEFNPNSWTPDPISEAKIIIIDEASMVNKEALSLIMENKSPNAKVIFLGDIGQLPPIEEDGSELPSRVFETKNTSKLLERVRQGESSPILPYADNFWNNSQSSKPEEYPVNRKDEVDKVTDAGSLVFIKNINDILKTVVEEFKTSVFDNNPNNIKIVSYRNDTRKSLNAKLRKEIFGEDSDNQFLKGDLIMFTNNYKVDRFTTISNSYETQVNDTKKDVYNGYNVWRIGFNAETSSVNESGKWDQVYVKVLASEDIAKFNSALNELKNNALSKPKKSKEAASAWREFYALKDMFAPVDYGYAITSHKSQGSTYNTVIVDSQDIMSVKPISAKTKSQAIYTALTRAKYTTIVVNGINETNTNNVEEALAKGDKDFQSKLATAQPMVDNKNNDENNLDRSEESGTFVEREFTPDNIATLKPNEIFVFGSNAEGVHGKGAALLAKQKFGAKQGQSEGLQGKSYAVITKKNWRVEKSSTLNEIGKGLQNMLLFAKENPKSKFLVTKLGSSLAGYKIEEIKSLFEKLKNIIPDNVILPKEYEVRDNNQYIVDDAKKPDMVEYTEEMQLKDANKAKKAQDEKTILKKSEYLRYSKSNDYFIVKKNFLGEARKLKADINKYAEIITEVKRDNKILFILNKQPKIRFNRKAAPVLESSSSVELQSKPEFSEEKYFEVRKEIESYGFKEEIKNDLISDLNNAKTTEDLGRLIKKMCKL